MCKPIAYAELGTASAETDLPFGQRFDYDFNLHTSSSKRCPANNISLARITQLGALWGFIQLALPSSHNEIAELR